MKTAVFLLAVTVTLGTVESARADAPAALQQATSSVQGYRDKAGCTITRASNTRYTPVGVNGYRNPGSLNLILQETFEQGDSDCVEAVDGKITVQATSYDPDFKEAKLLWSFSSEGWLGESEPDGHWSLYRVRMPGCCGSSDTDSYFSLWNGKHLFLGTGPILSLSVPNSGDVLRFFGLLDNAASMSFKEAAGADDAIAVLYLASDREPGETLVLHGHKGDAYHYSDLVFVVNGKPQTDRELDLWTANKSKDPKSITGFSIRGKLECECDRQLLTFEVPVVDGHLNLKGAKSSDPAVRFTQGTGTQ